MQVLYKPSENWEGFSQDMERMDQGKHSRKVISVMLIELLVRHRESTSLAGH